MEPKLSTLVLAVLGFLVSVHAVIVYSEVDGNGVKVPVLASPPPPPPPRSPPLPPRSPPYKKRSPPPPRLKFKNDKSHHHRKKRLPPPPPPPEPKLNAGKKVGLLFVGIGSILQICFAGFLVFKRRQLF